MNTDPIIAAPDMLVQVLIRLAVEVAVLLIIIPGIYRRFSANKDNMFSFFLMGIMIFLICVLLKKVEIQLGIALGLFAIFSIIRFRTSNFSTKDMSYLFTVMGLSAINAMFDFPNPIRGTILFNTIIIITLLLLEIFSKEGVKGSDVNSSEKKKKKKKDEKKSKKKKSPKPFRLIYDNIKLLDPAMREELLKDIYMRTGKKADAVKIRKMDLVKNNAELDVYYSDVTAKAELTDS